MKRVIAAIILIVIVASSYFLGDYYIKDSCKTANRLLNDCVTAYKNNQGVEKTAEELEDFWSKKESILSIFTNHNSIDEIELAINSLVIYSTTTEKEIFYEYSGRVKTLIHQLLEDNSISIHSIL